MMRCNNPDQVLVLFNASEHLIKGEAKDMLAEQGVIACAEAIAQALRAVGLRVELAPIRDDVESALRPFPPHEWTVFNLGEGSVGRLFEEARIAWALEAMGYCYTGSDGSAIARSVDKPLAKELLVAKGVLTPAWRVVRHADEVEAHLGPLAFPLIVKPVAEDASIGVGPEAVVHSLPALRERVGYVLRHYRQAAMVEAFIPGREFNISLWGRPPEVLPLAEVDFGAIPDRHAQIVSFAAKWEPDSFEYGHTPVICPARTTPELGREVRRTALRAWSAIGPRCYARVDMRISEECVPYVLEVNCNPDLSPDAGFYRAAHARGLTYAQMTLRILQLT
jgi:D-alanine-D-alanine ligase